MIPERSDVGGEGDEPVLARARARAKSAWSASLRADDLERRAASEARLINAWPRPRVLPVRAFVLGAAAAACVAAAAFAMFVPRAGMATAPLPVASATPTAPTSGNVAAPVLAATTGSAVAPVLPPVVEPAHGIVLTGPCAECKLDGAAAEPGATLGRRRLSVPRGANITIGFAMHGSSLIDPASGVDLQGPAVAVAPDDRTISLERGSARFRGLGDIVITVPGGRLVGTGATFSVSIDARGVSHVVVEKGNVIVTTLSTNKSTTAAAGTSVELLAAAEPVPPAPVAPVPLAPPPSVVAAAGQPADARDAVEKARARFHDGDSNAARTQLEALARSPDATIARRASFTLAEIEMASGEGRQRDSGRARLAVLSTGPDVKLASDAATLLARSEATASARADAWGRYLKTSPPSTYRHRALLERAEALIDAGRVSEASAILGELATAPLSDAQKRHLERLSFKARGASGK